MEPTDPTYCDFARWARQALEDVARDCDVQVFRASGPGGQCVNTTDSAVRMTHVPSGLTVVSRESRSQFRNRQLCLQKLRAQFERRAVPPKVRRATKVPLPRQRTPSCGEAATLPNEGATGPHRRVTLACLLPYERRTVRRPPSISTYREAVTTESA